MAGFEFIRDLILSDRSLTESLVTEKRPQLYARVIALAREHGIELTAAELDQVARLNRRKWLERAIPA